MHICDTARSKKNKRARDGYTNEGGRQWTQEVINGLCRRRSRRGRAGERKEKMSRRGKEGDRRKEANLRRRNQEPKKGEKRRTGAKERR